MGNKQFLTIFLCLAVAVSAQGYSPEYDQNGRLRILRADLDQDSYCDNLDIRLFALAWLEQDCGLSNSCNGADIYPEVGDGTIDFRDFSVSAGPYGLCTDPTDANCIHVPLTLYEPPSARGGGSFASGFLSSPGGEVMGVEPSPFIIYGSGGHGGPLADWQGGGGGEKSGYSLFWSLEFSEEPVTSVMNLETGEPLECEQEPVVSLPPVEFNPQAYSAYGGPSGDWELGGGGGKHGFNWAPTREGGELAGTTHPGSITPGEHATGVARGIMAGLLAEGGGVYNNKNIEGIFGDCTFYEDGRHHEYVCFQPGAPAWDDLGTLGSFGTYGGGAKPLLPSLPGGRGCLTVVSLAESGEASEPSEPIDVSLPEKGSASKLNLFSGEVCESAVDLHIASRGPDFVWQRVYRSRTGPNTVMGNGWDHSYNIYIEQDSSRLIVHNGCYGRRDPYFPEPNGIWAADGFFRELAQEDDGSFTKTFPDMGTWKFYPLDEPNVSGKISAITDRNGNSLTFDYDSLGRLTTVHDTLDTADNSREITIAYNADGLIESVTDWTGRQVTYAYYDDEDPNGSAGDLKFATSPAVRGTPTGNNFPAGKTTTYTYTKDFSDNRLNHNLLTITDPNGRTYLQNTYGTDPNDPNFDHVVRQILGEANDIIDFTYMQEVPDANNNYAVIRPIVNDREGNVTEHFYDNWNRLVILRQYTGRADPNLPTSIDPNVNMPTGKLRSDDPAFFETRFQYNKDFLPTRIDYPNGNYVTYVYESDLDPNAPPRSRGNLREIHRSAGSLWAVSDQNEITALFEYDPNVNNGTNRVTRCTDPRGNETLYDYDPNGNHILTEYVRPADSNVTYRWQYNENGQVTAQVLPDNGSGRQRRDEYTYYTTEGDPNYGYLKDVIVDANNLALTATYKYDEVGNVRCVTDPRGHDTQLVVNQLDQVVRITSREVTDSSGVRHQRDIYYDENDNIVQVDIQNKDEEGELQPNTHFTTAFEHDILNRLIRTTAEVDVWNSVVTEFGYDDNGSLTLIRFGEAANGNQPKNAVRYLYDERGLLFQTVRAGTDPNQSSTQFDYDGNGNLTKVQQGLEATPRVSSFVHDGFGRLVEVSNLMGNVFEYDYDPAGNVAANRIEGELVDEPTYSNNVRLYESSFEYDSLNRLIRAEVLHFDPNTQAPIGDGNSVAQIFYSDNSQVTKVVDDRGNETHCEYDTANRRSVVTDAKGNKVTLAYDENSNVTALTEVEKSDLGDPNEAFVTALQYDNLDRLTRVTDNNDNSTWFAYDSRGNCTQITDALNKETRCEYDGLSRLTQTVRDMDGDGADAGDANDIVASQTWDDSSRLVAQTDDNSNTTAYEYDALNRITKIIYADGTDKQLVYDIHDNVTESTDAMGSGVDSTYDLLNRLTSNAITPGLGVSSDTTFENYKYDGLSRLVFAQDNDSNLTFGYDSLSNVITEKLNGKTTSSVYDGMGNRLSCTYPGGRVISCTYDELNRKKTISDGIGQIASYDYIGPGRVERCSFSNTTLCDYSYDDVKRITATTHVFDPCRADTVIDSRTYTWDKMYNKTQRKDIRADGPKLTHDYSYDDIYRLTETNVTDNIYAVVRNTVYTLDGVGNRTEVTGSPDPGNYTMDSTTPEPADANMNQYTTTPFDTRLYDKNGNLITIDNGQPTQKDIIYDYRNQMVEFNDVNTGKIYTWAYDAIGRPIFSSRLFADPGHSGGALYIYDGDRVIEELDPCATTVATYVYGNYIDEVLNMQRDSNDYYYHADELYSVMAVTDACGLVVERYEYGDYGEPNVFDGSGTLISSTAIGNRYLFTGRRYDPNTGWYNYRSRYLDPIAGRFTTRDTIGIWADASNLGNGYTYVGNNPASNVDQLVLRLERVSDQLATFSEMAECNMLSLQKVMNQHSQTLQMISNIMMKTSHDTAKPIITGTR